MIFLKHFMIENRKNIASLNPEINTSATIKMKNLSRKAYFWIAIFGVIFLLTQDNLFIKYPADTFLFGLPNWLFWLMTVHVVFVVVFYFFSKKYWKE